jgi:hypothetical protein
MARRKKSSPPVEGRDSFHVLTDTGAQLSTKGAAPHALLVAQRAAEQSKEEITLTVERRSLFGPKVTIYRVTRVESGAVFTNTNPVD